MRLFSGAVLRLEVSERRVRCLLECVFVSGVIATGVVCGNDSGSSSAVPTTSTPASASTNPKQAPSKKNRAEEPKVDPLPPRPPIELTASSFGRRRDPFVRHANVEVDVVQPIVEKVQRPVVAAQYALEELRLIAIVNAGRGLTPRALFLASDSKSTTIKQGEYFSSAEVLLAAVNRNYVEIEVVDTDLASNLDLQRGERRAIYLEHD